MANFFNHTDEVNHSAEYYVQQELDDLVYYHYHGMFCSDEINEFHIINAETNLPRISSEERQRQKVLIDEISREYQNRKSTRRLSRSMNDVGVVRASYYARKFPGKYQCTCHQEDCSVINVHSSTEFTVESVCENGDGGIGIMKHLNRLGFGLYTN